MQENWSVIGLSITERFCPHKFTAYRDKHPLREIRRGESVYSPGDATEEFYLVVKGSVKICSYDANGKEIVKQIIGPASIFGYHGLVGELERNDFAISEEAETSICVLNQETLQHLQQQESSMVISLYRWVGFSLRKVERRLEVLLHKSAMGRLCHLLLDMVEEQDEKIILSQANISALIGVARPTVNSLLKELEKQGHISIRRRCIQLKNPEKIRELSAS